MDFEERSITLQEADRRYSELKRQHEAGAISDEGFDEQLKQLMVLDDQSRWWAKSRSTGEWHYYNGTAWVSAEPPYEQSQPSQEPGPYIHKPSYDKLIRICAKYDGPRFYVGDSIPKRMLSRARSRFPIPADERVAALVDTSLAISPVFSNGFGLALCEDGLRWRTLSAQVWGLGTILTGSMGWPDFAAASVEAVDSKPGRYVKLLLGEGDDYKLLVGKDNVVAMENKFFKQDSLIRLLAEVQSLITSSTPADGA